MRILKFLLCAFVICHLSFVTACKTLAQVPEPYVPKEEVRPRNIIEEGEWHSLRPYQASPANIPLNPKEQALLCGNDLIINDIVDCANGECVKIECSPHCPGPCGSTTCKVYSKRVFEISFDAFASELPIAGNTELVKGDDLNWLQSALNQNWRLTDSENSFSQHKPPDITQYPDYSDYYEAYMEWRGKTCISTNDIPIIGKFLPDVMICFEDSLNPNFWADLYPKIPYSSTEDRIGKARVYGMIYDAGKSSVDRIAPDPPQSDFQPHDPAYGKDPEIEQKSGKGRAAYGETPLYFPHMEENVELSSLLQSTYVPKELQTVEPSPGPNVIPSPEPDPDCKIVNIRYNPGDQLFGERERGKGVPIAEVSYTAFIDKCEAMCINPDPLTGMCTTLVLLCVRNAWFHSDVDINTPLIDELFGQTITNETSILRKTFPRVGDEGAPLGKIEDIPASTGVGHTGHNIQPKDAKLEVISFPAEFYIPHFGSIYDYLLHDMQTLLRPKGFPGKPAGLTKSTTIPEINQANEYLSWYLNGTIYRAEQKPLSTANCIGETTKKAGTCQSVVAGQCMASLVPPLPSLLKTPDGKSNCTGLISQCCIGPLAETTEKLDLDRVVDQSGPLNKLLSQQSQWRNTFQTYKESFAKSLVSRVGETDPRAKDNRHSQIVGCTLGIPIPAWIPIIGNIIIGGFPIPCESESQKNLPPEVAPPSSPPSPPSGTCPNVPDSAIDSKYLTMKDNFIKIANTYGEVCNLAEECYNYVVKESKSAGVNPALSLAIWVHESAASNYCVYPKVEDFGVHYIPGEDLIGQLSEWLAIAKGTNYLNCYNSTPGWKEPLHTFLSQYRTGSGTPPGSYCNPNDTDGNSFYETMITAFQNVCDPVASCVGSGYSEFLIDYPTDNSCP